MMPISSRRSLSRAFVANNRGSVAIISALTLSVAVMGVGVGIDFGRAANVRAALQAASDAAALNGANDTHVHGSDRIELANQAFHANFDTASYGGIEPIVTVERSKVRVFASVNLQTSFMRIAGITAIPISTEAVADIAQYGNPCVLALDQSASSAIKVHGNAQLEAKNCGIHTNSMSATAIRGLGNAEIIGTTIRSSGGSDGTRFRPPVREQADIISDPLASLPEPVPPAVCKSVVGPRSPANSCYTGNVNLMDTVFEPGIHYFMNAKVSITSNSQLVGSNVMLYLGPGTTLSISGNGNLALTPPISGPYKGVTIFASRAGGGEIKMTGGREWQIAGTIYAPTTDLRVAGNAEGDNGAKLGFIISRTLDIGGTSRIIFDSASGVYPDGLVKVDKTATLVE